MRKITKALAVTAATGGFMLSAAGAAVATDDKDDNGRDDHGYSACDDKCDYDKHDAKHDACDDDCGLTFSVTLPCPSCGGYGYHDHDDDCDDACKSDRDDHGKDDEVKGDKDDKGEGDRPAVKSELAKTGMNDVAMAPIGAGLVLGGAMLYRRSRVRTNA